MHYHFVEDSSGDLVDLVPFCSDACHQAWCTENDVAYGGWSGANEGGDSAEFCAHCGTFAGGTPECDHQRDNVVVNRFRCDDGEQCECGHWLQLPARFVETCEI